MLEDITIGQYFPGHSLIHLLDPRIKIIAAFILMFIIFLVRSFEGYGIIFLFISLIILISGIPPKFVIKGLKPLIFILMLTFAINLFFTPGEQVAFRLWTLTVTWEGIRQGSFMALRLVFLVIGMSLLTLTTSPISLTDGIEHLLNPLKVIGFPAHELAMMMTIALRFIPTLLEETDKIMKAQMARGADFESGNIFQRAKALVPLLVPLFISAFRRADELAIAMESRCYRGGEKRTRMKMLKTQRRDYIALALVLFLCVVIICDSFILNKP